MFTCNHKDGDDTEDDDIRTKNSMSPPVGGRERHFILNVHNMTDIRAVQSLVIIRGAQRPALVMVCPFIGTIPISLTLVFLCTACKSCQHKSGP